MKTIIGHLEFLAGRIESGHFELSLSEEDFEKFNKLSEDEKKDYLELHGNIIVDYDEITDYGSITELKVY